MAASVPGCTARRADAAGECGDPVWGYVLRLPSLPRVGVREPTRKKLRARFAQCSGHPGALGREWLRGRLVSSETLPDRRNCGQFGAACDNLLSAHVVTMDGKQVEASLRSNSDLFWAIRGGGGNFGVLTALEYQLHPVDQVLSGALTYPAGRIPELLHGFVRFLAGAPDETDAFAQLLPSRQGRRLTIDLCCCGNPRMGNNLLSSLRALKPQEDSVRIMPYLEAQAAGGISRAAGCAFSDERLSSRTQRGCHRGNNDVG
jgi:hypothetical protein